MTKSKLEYIWLDGYKPTQSLRSKTRVEKDFSGKLEDCPVWSFDGSSTRTGHRRCVGLPDPSGRDLSRSGARERFPG